MTTIMKQTDPSYTLYLSSNDKISGTHNNANFNINWDSFLPREIDQFKINYSFITTGGFYNDSSTVNNFIACKIVLDFSGRSLSYDTANSGQSLTLGYAQRTFISDINPTNYYSSSFYQHPGKTIARPTQNNVNIKIYNNAYQASLSNQLLKNNTDNASVVLASDMTSWNMIIDFIPIVLLS